MGLDIWREMCVERRIDVVVYWGMVCLVAEHMWAGCGGGGREIARVYPFFHFTMAACGDGACEWCFDEFGCESEEFFVCVFVDVLDDLLGGE